MKFKVVAVLIALGLIGVASANILVNPGFEIGTAGGAATPDGWWKPNNSAGTETWAAQSGTNGFAFFSWTADNWSYLLQDVYTNAVAGEVVTFSIWGQAQNFTSTGSECYMKLEFWQGGTLAYTVTNSVYDAIVADRFDWNQYSMTATVAVDNVTLIKPMFGYGQTGATMGGDQAVLWDNADLTIAAIPEPMSAMLLGIGLYGVAWTRRLVRK